jgi:hypothetical protein
VSAAEILLLRCCACCTICANSQALLLPQSPERTPNSSMFRSWQSELSYFVRGCFAALLLLPLLLLHHMLDSLT